MTAAITLTDLQNAALDVGDLAEFVNTSSGNVTTRLGAVYPTLQQLLTSIGFLPPVAYASGLTVNSVLYTVTSGGLIYAPLPNLVPFVTAGAFNAAQWYLLQVAPSTFIKTLLDDVDAPTARATLLAAASGVNTDLTNIRLSNTGLFVKGVASANALNIKPGTTLSADRILTIITGNSDRSFDISAANLTFSAFVATLVDDANAAAFLTTLGVSAFVQTLLDDAAAINFRSTLGVKETRYCDIGDETTTITSGTGKFSFRMPFAATLVGLPRASLATAASAGIHTIDINKNGVSIMTTTKLTIDATEKTSATAAVAAVVTTTSFAADDEITIDIDVAGTGPKGLKVQLDFAY